jgi:murein L,D-transpeptidase YcbB/YkuD
MIKKYSLKAQGNEALSKNFKVKEFKCKDGSDEVKVDEGLVEVLQKIRDYFSKAITVVSDYRTPAYNKRIKGASKSQHLYGRAADIQVAGVKPRTVAEYAESIGVKGLGLYDYSSGGFVHVDTRANRARWLQKTRNGSALSVGGFFPESDRQTLKKNSRGSEVRELQEKLNSLGFDCGVADGIFGKNTLKAVKEFQKSQGIKVDGIVGPQTWAKLK